MPGRGENTAVSQQADFQFFPTSAMNNGISSTLRCSLALRAEKPMSSHPSHGLSLVALDLLVATPVNVHVTAAAAEDNPQKALDLEHLTLALTWQLATAPFHARPDAEHSTRSGVLQV